MDLKQVAKDTARNYGIDPALFCALIEQESGWDQYSVRVEPAFYEKYTKPMNLSDTEEYCRAMSWGFTQIMGETARELGFKERWLTRLLDPGPNFEYGCKKLLHCFAKSGGDVEKALLQYNGGSNHQYPQQVLARLDKYK